MRRLIIPLAAAALTVTLASCGVSQPPTANALAPADRDALIEYLHSISGQSIVSGQHNKEPANQPSQYTAQVHAITGEYPGMWGGDLMFRAEDAAKRQQVIDQAKLEWTNGSLVALTWHVCPPTGPPTCEFEGGVKSSIDDTEFDEIVTGGTALNQEWRNRMAEVVPYLRQLNDAGVPVLFRPFHEMNEEWNWWGARPGENGGAKIFQQMKDYFDSEGLDNLVWVWNVQDNEEGGWDEYYPGDDYVDVLSLDVWYKEAPSREDYDQLRAISPGKPIALGELGTIPSPGVIEDQPEWTYFMVWSEQLTDPDYNSDDAIRATYADPRVLNQGEVKLF